MLTADVEGDDAVTPAAACIHVGRGHSTIAQSSSEQALQLRQVCEGQVGEPKYDDAAPFVLQACCTRC